MAPTWIQPESQWCNGGHIVCFLILEQRGYYPLVALAFQGH